MITALRVYATSQDKSALAHATDVLNDEYGQQAKFTEGQGYIEVAPVTQLPYDELLELLHAAVSTITSCI